MIESINFSYKDNRIDKFNYNRHSHGKQYEIVPENTLFFLPFVVRMAMDML